MSLPALVLSLIAEIRDPTLRTDVAGTIYFLRDLYVDGRIGEEELAREVRDVVRMVVAATRPDLPPPQVEEVSAEIAGQIVAAIKMDTLKGRTMTRHAERRWPEL